MKANPCECGNDDLSILFLHGSTLKLRVVGCKKCHSSGPARMDNASAIVEWNKGRRVINGELVEGRQ